ncbi:acetate/propionate family kinase [Streptomyces sp. SBT349]|uniref:acetate/propionate family kinase n=1 Tax=Streptomyces sp. SBT349 TaxID=1580539 RepID=UPI00066BCF4D|nr:acetate/propionate family kinase [Streptomyces sp. SBT349]
MNAPAAGRVLVVDAGSASLHLVLVGGDDTVLARSDVGSPRELTDLGWVPPDAVGHRFVHGGPRLSGHTPVDGEVRSLLQEAAELAPLHLPPALHALDAVRRLLPDVPHVACLDTVFHARMPAAAREYAVPEEWRTRYGLRRYGFHGLSYAWALDRAARLLDRPADSLHLVLAHLGGGCSACAVRDGVSVDTTMGLTPLEGLVMSHRSGTVDPGALTWLQRRHGLTAEEIEDVLNHRSGLLGLSGTSDDTRDLVAARAAGDERAELALACFTHSARRAIASMAASLDRLDALVLTGEIGEDQPEVREEICAGLPVLGLAGPRAATPVFVVPTGEPQQIARETRAVLAA